ncbi:hypothetical protein QYE76_005915 [Lolium multiflorum]|uniref:C2H2-type domain-containing protein n=1 Tax=Lolium multiflorum TaxID=4521 RepID=A0AAD8RUL7_LOLMU|nr:hypothetical protein QYE76_005915 [Lolium multiflorum]
MGTEVAPTVDLGALSQSDLVALAAASPYAGGRRDADILPPPKIDRAVFNESAGSRKQTFSRHRVATNLSHNATPSTASTSTAAPTDEDSENRLIVFHLQRLFARHDPSYPQPPPIQPQTLTAPPLAVPATPVAALPIPSLPDPDRELMNPKGAAVDLARLAGLVDPYGEEMQKQTAGLVLESALLGFMNGLEGQWGSRRRRRKFVDAAMFGDHLPRGWKLILGIKRKERVAWINCRRYVSPRGHQFATCKEVSSYLMSLVGYVEAKLTPVQSNNVGVCDFSAVNSLGLHQQADSTEDTQSAVPATSFALSIHSGDSQGQRQKPYKDEVPIQADTKECKKCKLTFQDQSAYVQHQLSFHQRKAKRRRVDKSVDLGVGKDEKLETRECQRTSEDKPGYFDYGVADVKNQDQTAAELFGGTSSGELGTQPSLAAVPCGSQEMTGLPEQNEKPSSGEPVSGHQKDPVWEINGLPQQEKESSASEPCTEHQKELFNNSGDHGIRDGACHIAEESLTSYVASDLRTCKSPEVHKHDSSKAVEFPSADCSRSFNTSDDFCSITEEVAPNIDAPAESKCTDHQMDFTDITLSERASEHCDLLDPKFSSFAGETEFNDQVKNSPLSANLDEPDLSSIGMEVDESKFRGVVNPTSSEYHKTVEDQIDQGVAASRNDEINIDVRIRDVNLNSCLDTVSSPVSGTNCETSNALHDRNRSSIIAQCFGASPNDDNVCQDEGFVNQNNVPKAENFVNHNNVPKAEIFVNHNNDMMYQSNLTMNPISPAQISVDYFNASCSVTPEIKNDASRRDNAKEQFVNSGNISSNEAGYDAEAYNNDIFTGAIGETSFAQLTNAMNMKADFSSCYSLSDLNTLTGGTPTDVIDFNGMRSSFASGSTRRSEPNELDFDIKGSMLEALERSDSDLENQYNGGDPACDSLPAAGTSGSMDDFMSMHANFGSLTSLVRSVEGGPMSRLIQDQCDLQLGFGAQKQQMYPTFEEHLRMASAGAPQFGNLGRHNPVPVPEPTLMLGYEPTLMLGYGPPFGNCPPVQLGWDMSKMVGMLQSVCVWCNTRFQHFGTAEQQADSVGFICPSCKDKTSGHLSILNNGSSL